jgi:hypothetical protein
MFVNWSDDVVLGGLFGIFRFDERLEIVEVHGPEAAVLLEPGVDSAQRFRIEVVDAMAAFPVLANEVGAAEQSQVSRDSWARHGKRLGNGSGGLAATAQKIENRAPRGIGDGLERGLGVLRGRICNRTVPHTA